MRRWTPFIAGINGILLLFFSQGFSQPSPDTLWTRTYGGSYSEEARCVQQTEDGGYIVAGYTDSFGAGNSDFYLVKTNSEGDTLWTRTYGRSYYKDRAYSVQQTTDGGYIVAGYTESFVADSGDFYLVKTNSEGDTLWTRTYGGSSDEWIECVQQTTDGGYIMAGTSSSFGSGFYDFYVIKTDSQGNSLWASAYGGSSYDGAYSIQQTIDGSYIVAGLTWSFGGGRDDLYLVKMNSQGDTLWTRTYGGSNFDEAESVQQTTDGGYIVAGCTQSFGMGSVDFYLVKTDSQGDTLWTRTYGGSDWEMACSIQQTTDGGYIAAGITKSFGAGIYDFYLVKTDAQGDTLWTRTFGGISYDEAYSVQQTTDGGYIVAGRTNSFGAGFYDFYLVKTGPDISPAKYLEHPSPTDYTLYPNFPNPFNPYTQITYSLPKSCKVSLRIFNLLGQEIALLVNESQSAGTHTIVFNSAGLSSGIYLYRLNAENFSQTKKMVLLK